MIKGMIITGGIGSGKSSVTKIFEDNGYRVIDADKISGKLLEFNMVAIAKHFGLPPQKFSTFKKSLGALVFQDPEKLKELEDTLLPMIRHEIEFLALDNMRYNRKYVVEMPTYYKHQPLEKSEDFVINVHTDKAIRVQRVLERNKHLSIQDVLDRMKAQPCPIKIKEVATVTIENSGTYEELKENTEKFIKELENENS